MTAPIDYGPLANPGPEADAAVAMTMGWKRVEGPVWTNYDPGDWIAPDGSRQWGTDRYSANHAHGFAAMRDMIE